MITVSLQQVFYVDVIHTVGPRGEKPELLKLCYERCLELSLENNIRTIVNISIPVFTVLLIVLSFALILIICYRLSRVYLPVFMVSRMNFQFEI